MDPLLEVAASVDELTSRCATVIHADAARAVRERGVFRFVLSGGGTPRALYERLADDSAFRDFPWPHTQVFWGDERHVGPDHPDSNFKMANDALLRKVAVPPEAVFRMAGEDADAARAADHYEATVRTACGLAPGAWPRFDLVLMGIGPDGHTASLFPDHPLLEERQRLVAAPWVEKMQTFRITMTLPVFNQARHALFLAAGEEKAAAIAAAVAPPADAAPPPAGLVRPVEGTLTWMLDREAAALIEATDDEQ